MASVVRSKTRRFTVIGGDGKTINGLPPEMGIGAYVSSWRPTVHLTINLPNEEIEIVLSSQAAERMRDILVQKLASPPE